jgi:hypothetical protein
MIRPMKHSQPLEVGVPGAGAGFDRQQAFRAWEIAVRLREQSRRLGVAHDMSETFLT